MSWYRLVFSFPIHDMEENASSKLEEEVFKLLEIKNNQAFAEETTESDDMVEWSWEILVEDEERLLRLFSELPRKDNLTLYKMRGY